MGRTKYEGRCCHTQCDTTDNDDFYLSGRRVTYTRCVSNLAEEDDEFNVTPGDEDDSCRDNGFIFTLCSECHKSTDFFGGGESQSAATDFCDICERDVINGKCGKLDGERICVVCIDDMLSAEEDFDIPNSVADEEYAWFEYLSDSVRASMTVPEFKTMKPVVEAYKKFLKTKKEEKSVRRGVAVKRIGDMGVKEASSIVKLLGKKRCGSMTHGEITDELINRLGTRWD